MDSRTIVAPMTLAGSLQTRDERVWDDLEKYFLGVLGCRDGNDVNLFAVARFFLNLFFCLFLRQNDGKIPFLYVKFHAN